tara:strand:+ start:2277 stop:3440 length:1164 start_codon:yes stop_codon:yes gene_type:complete
MKNILITMSGGTTSVINATLSGLIEQSQKSNKINRIFAGCPGIVGFMERKVKEFTLATKQDLNLIASTPGSAIVGTTRTKIFDDKDISILNDLFQEYEIGYFVNIGGNGTIKQTRYIASKINDIKVASAPKTVDNDLGDEDFNDLWFTPGFPSCVNFWYHKMSMLNNENLGARTNDQVLVTQTFGRETGFIVGAMRRFDPLRKLPIVLLLPEDQRNIVEVLDAIDNTVSKHNRAIVGICEGYDVSPYGYNLDLTGQRMYGSSKSTAMQELINECNDNRIQARGYNPTIDQRQNYNYTLKDDLKISNEIGKRIIKNFDKGKSHFFQGYTKSQTYETISLSSIKDYSRSMKEEWIDWGNFDVTDEYLSYIDSFTKISEKKKMFYPRRFC